MDESRSPDRPRRWQRVVRGWRSWSPFIPPALYLIGLLLRLRVNGPVGTAAWIAYYGFYGFLLVPLGWRIIKANPGIFRQRWLRFVLAGTGFMIAACVGLPLADIFTGSTVGIVQTSLVVVASVGFGVIFVAMFAGLLSASKSVIERYRASH